MRLVIFDIETDALEISEVSKIHTTAFAYEGSRTATTCKEAVLRERLYDSSAITGHNIIRYDIPVLQKMGVLDDFYLDGYEAKSPDGRCLFHVVDTLLFSRLISPESKEHGLDVWGERVGIAKPVINDWGNLEFSAYQHRCEEDVKINSLVWDAMKDRAHTVERAYQTEAHFADIIAKQVQNGFRFDVKLAKKVCLAIEKRMAVLEESVMDYLPMVQKNKGDLKRAKIPSLVPLKKGGLSVHTQRFLEKHSLTYNERTKLLEREDGTIIDPKYQTHVKTKKPLKLSNQAGMKEYLFSLGWEPEYWNFKKDKTGRMLKLNGEFVRASPKVRSGEAICLSLVGLMSGAAYIQKTVKAYIAYSVYKHRLSSLEGMLKQKRLRIDGRIGADMNTIGAATGRVTHKVVANIPKSLNEFDDQRLVVEGVIKSKHIMRACFRAGFKKILVGIDASAIEARVEAHFVYKYEGGVAYGAALLGVKPNDIHTINSRKLRVTRDLAKSIKYALGYGASVRKIMTLLRCDLERAQEVYDDYWESAKCVRMLLLDLEQQWLNNNNRIKAIDGRPLFVDSSHKLLNYSFQSTGTIIMKNAACIMDRRLRKEGLYRFDAVKKVCDYHDEFQFECDREVKGLARYIGEIGVESIREAGVVLGLNVPLDGEFKIGNHWGMTH
jgi:hypothetical protein